MKISSKGVMRIRRDISKKSYILGACLSFAGLLLLWSLASYTGLVNNVFLPTPTSVAATFAQEITLPDFWSNIGISFFRILMGFLIAAAIGVPLGILAGTYRTAESVIQPLNEFFRYIPATAFVPLVMVWAGIGEMAKIVIIFIGTIFQVVLMVADDIRAIPQDLLSSSYTLGANQRQVIGRVMIPAVLPKLMDTLRMLFGWSWTYLVVAELVAANSGLGYMIIKAQRFLQTDLIFVGILVIGILGLITDRLFFIMNKKLFPWAEGGK